jgi:hypothetical protein
MVKKKLCCNFSFICLSELQWSQVGVGVDELFFFKKKKSGTRWRLVHNEIAKASVVKYTRIGNGMAEIEIWIYLICVGYRETCCNVWCDGHAQCNVQSAIRN